MLIFIVSIQRGRESTLANSRSSLAKNKYSQENIGYSEGKKDYSLENIDYSIAKNRSSEANGHYSKVNSRYSHWNNGYSVKKQLNEQNPDALGQDADIHRQHFKELGVLGWRGSWSRACRG